MMQQQINEQTWAFIRQHQHDDVRRLALQGTKDADVDLPTALQQIAGWQTARRKLPSWAAVEGIVYPPHLNMEQCSSEQTARYKAQLVRSWVMGDRGWRFVDLTGGFGVDFYFMASAITQHPSPNIHHLTYVEQNEQLCAISSGNFHRLELSCSVCCGNAADYLATMTPVDLIFLDPARRNEHGARTYSIEDCTPNVLELLPLLLQKSHRVMLKLSPMLDWCKAVRDLQHVSEVHIVSIAGECKELLLVLCQEVAETVHVYCINDESSFDFKSTAIKGSQNGADCGSEPFGLRVRSVRTGRENYLYEPNASIMKAGCFAEVARTYGVQPVAENSHLFLSADEIGDFPGRRFQILAISSVNKKALNECLSQFQSPLKSANISVRNFPLSAEQLRKKLKLKDGGDIYIFATTTQNGSHQLFICRKIG